MISFRTKILSAAAVSVLAVLGIGQAIAASALNPLEDHVRAANNRFRDVSVAIAEGYIPIPCVSGNDGGARHVPRNLVIGLEPGAYDIPGRSFGLGRYD